MDAAGGGRKPALEGRGFFFTEQLTAIGFDPTVLRSLVETGVVDGLLRPDGSVLGVFEDTLPTVEELRAWGVEPPADYSREAISAQPPSWPADATGDGAASWTMSWPG